MKGGINRPASKGENKDNTYSLDENDFGVRGKEGAEWEMTKGMRTKTKRARRRRRRRRKRGGEAAAD